jgi:hypothetical protein
VIDKKEAPNKSKVKLYLIMDWIEFYPDASEDIPHDIPKPTGAQALLTCYMDADSAGDKVTCFL